ncbi:hypothetical protein KCU65_g353, partial [Aureobasidium melanogenum]
MRICSDCALVDPWPRDTVENVKRCERRFYCVIVRDFLRVAEIWELKVPLLWIRKGAVNMIHPVNRHRIIPHVAECPESAAVVLSLLDSKGF